MTQPPTARSKNIRERKKEEKKLKFTEMSAFTNCMEMLVECGREKIKIIRSIDTNENPIRTFADRQNKSANFFYLFLPWKFVLMVLLATERSMTNASFAVIH